MRTGSDGFSLTELAVAVFAAALLLLIVFPAVRGSLQPAHVSGSARRLSAVVMRLHGEAVFTGKKHLLRIDLEAGEYAGAAELPEGGFALIEDTRGRLPEGVSFSEAVVAGERVSGGMAEVVFMPSGMASPAIIRIAGGGESVSLVIDGATGRARVVDDYSEEVHR